MGDGPDREVRSELPATRLIRLQVDDEQAVSGLLTLPHRPKACLMLAHGAGAGMTHPFMAAIADGLADRDVASMRYQFLYMERGSRRPDHVTLATTVVRAAAAKAAGLLPTLPLFAGGKSFGGRMTSQAQAREALPNVRGLVFFGFPLHPAKAPSLKRADHLADVHIPMLFLQGGRDALAERDLLDPVVEHLGAAAVLHILDGADHSFHVPVRSGRSDAQVLAAMLDVASDWMIGTCAGANDPPGEALRRQDR